MDESNGRDAHAKPPAAIRDWYKAAQKGQSIVAQDAPNGLESGITYSGDEEPTTQPLAPDFLTRLRQASYDFTGMIIEIPRTPSVHKVPSIPGLLVYPSLLPPEVQLLLLDKIFHRDLSHRQHQTNVHMHYDVPYPSHQTSFFDLSAADLTFTPRDSAIHKPFNTKQYLDRKLRWMTLGGQYDWTRKIYPSTPPPGFPADIEHLIAGIFNVKAEAAIVNLYSPGDTLSLHRDVSEECDQALVSISLGCDGIFVVGLDGIDGGEPRAATIRLRSGDAVVMSGESRHAWHGVPKVVKGTCPPWMEDWPCTDTADQGKYSHWKGWMAGKRVNLNVRQMFDHAS